MKEHLKEALRISGIYAGVSALWIFLSDGLIKLFARDPDVITTISMYKGWGFVLLTSILFFFLLKKRLAALTEARDQALSASEKVNEQMRSLSSLFDAAQLLADRNDVIDRADKVTEVCVERLGVQLAWIGRAADDGSIGLLSQYPATPGSVWPKSARWDLAPGGMGPTGIVIREGAAICRNDLSKEIRDEPWKRCLVSEGHHSMAAFPLIMRGRTFGILALASVSKGFFTEERLRVFQALANQTAASLENARLLNETQRQLASIQALHNIDTAIIESIADQGVFDMTLDTIIQQLGIDAASILYRDPKEGKFELLSARGVSTATILAMANCNENSLARQALEKGKPYITGRLAEGKSCEARERLLAEGMNVFCAIPLSSKDEALGVLELFSRRPFDPAVEWNEYLAMFVGQVTIAFNNMEMVRKLERSNEGLVKAYDATIETLSFALDLKDHGTNWHSKRVTELTMLLARSMGIAGDGLSQVWRGAMLHDIGKIGIPDRILLKPGALDDEEMAAMRKHTVYAYQMLSHIDYLAQAIDIPYAHHEKWDGSGYPRGLSGEAIPLAARVFAVIDVYDALTSDRPYRPAWTAERALAEIRAQAGRHFDPAVVEAFFALLATEEGLSMASRGGNEEGAPNTFV